MSDARYPLCTVRAACAAGFLLLSGVARAAEPAAPPGSPPQQLSPAQAGGPAESAKAEVSFAEGLLTVSAKGADFRALFAEVSKKTGIEILVDEAIHAQVTVEIKAAKLDDAVKKILQAAGQENVAVEYVGTAGAKLEDYKVQKVTILRKGEATSPQPPVGPKLAPEVAKRLRARELEYRALFEEMAKKKSPIADAIAEFKDPKTSERRRTKMKTFLRQTAVKDPKDRELLKAAIFQRENLVLINDLEMALLHAIQDNPQESDKEYLLHLFSRPDIGMGWLMYALPDVWDERYVPHLLDGARKGWPTDIEILGRMKVKEAVPVLEELVRNGQGLTPQNAANALFLITGRKYEY